MVNNRSLIDLTGILSAEVRLVRRARSGSISAFLELSEPLFEKIYCYIYFLVPTNRIAEALTLQVFFKAWGKIHRYPLLGSSFSLWMFAIARQQVLEHQRTHTSAPRPDTLVSTMLRGGEFRQDHQSLREIIHTLEPDLQHYLTLKFIARLPEKEIAALLKIAKGRLQTVQNNALFALASKMIGWEIQPVTDSTFQRTLHASLTRLSSSASTLDDVLFLYPKSAATLEPLLKAAVMLQNGRDAKPPAPFDGYVHDALLQYLHTRSRQALGVSAAAVRRVVLATLIAVFAFLATGTAYAQSSMPGDTFYSWKRASENIWLAVASNPTHVNLVLTERRLNEWLAVADDPLLAEQAQSEYQAALTNLNDMLDPEELEEVSAVLQEQQQALTEAGLSSTALDAALADVLEQLGESASVVETPVPTILPLPPVANPGATIVLDGVCPPNCDMNALGTPISTDDGEVPAAVTPTSTKTNNGKNVDKDDKDKPEKPEKPEKPDKTEKP